MAVNITKQGIINASGNNIGANILLGSHVNQYTSVASGTTDRDSGIFSVGSGGNGTFSITVDNTCPVGFYSFNVLNNTSGNRDFQQGGIPYEAGQVYTGSWWAKGSGTCLYRSWNRTKGNQPMGKTFTLTSDWKLYTHTFTATQVMEDDNCTWHLGVTGASSINICGMKLEKGSVATPWIPNVDDEIYVGNSGFIEISTPNTSIGKDYIVSNEFIEF